MISEADEFFILHSSLLCRNINQLLVLAEPLLIEEGAERGDFRNLIILLEFLLQIAALETEQTIRQGILTSLLEVLLDDLHQVGQLHYGTAHHEVVLAFLVLTAQVFSHQVLESDSASHLIAHLNLLAGAVDELELALREEDGERDARKTTAASEVENL